LNWIDIETIRFVLFSERYPMVLKRYRL